MQLDHINIRARDQEAMKDFLVAVLGLEVGPRPPFDFPGYWLYLGEQALIHMQGSDRDEDGVAWVDHIAFGPFAFAEKSAELDQAGIAYRFSDVPGRDLRQIFVAGPEGIKLELQCPGDAA
ncbi:VOC family protein [Bauldia sp.]|uniref:VOC family protein n=1 Tax=Bauldia sp. TaxID=2575872 RepID=UPI003BACFC6B